jgi:hypothetical protein
MAVSLKREDLELDAMPEGLRGEGLDGLWLQPEHPEPVVEIAVYSVREVDLGEEEIDRDAQSASYGVDALEADGVDAALVSGEGILADIGQGGELALLHSAASADVVDVLPYEDGETASGWLGIPLSRHDGRGLCLALAFASSSRRKTPDQHRGEG